MASLPPGDWDDLATKDDLRAHLEQVDARFEQVDARFDMFEQRFEVFEQRVDLKLELHAAQLRSEFDTKLAATTRTLVLANIGSILTVGALAFGAAGLS